MTKFKAPDYTPVPSGIYPGRFEGTEQRESERGGYVRWGWRIANGEFASRMVFGNTSTNFGPQAKARKWLESILDRCIEPGEEVDPDDLTGETHKIRVENTAPDNQGRVEKSVKVCEKDHHDILVVDTFAAFAELVGSEENNAGDIHERMEPLKKAAQSHDLAVLLVRHAGKDGKGRGSSQFEAEVDIVATLKRPEGNHAETVRQLETIGRYGATKLNIELTEEGYAPLGSDEKVAFTKAVKFVKGALPRQKENAITEDALIEKAKEEVSKGTLIRALRWLVDQGTVKREGAGKKGSPYTYWLPPSAPEPPENSFSPNPLSLGGEKEKGERIEGGRGSSGTHELVSSTERVEEVAAFLEDVTEAAIDIETTGLSPVEDKVRLFSGHAGGRTLLIDAFEVSPSPVLKMLKNKPIYVHGAEFDLPFLYHCYGFEPPENVIDTLHLSQVARAGEWKEKAVGGWERERHSLKDALERELGLELPTDKKRFQSSKAWTGDLTDDHLEYAAADVVHLKALADKLLSLVEERDLGEVWKLEQRAKPLFLDMCVRGIPLDKGCWERLTGELEDRVLSLKEKADEIAPAHPENRTWSWNSPKQAKTAFSLAGLEVLDLKRETLSKYRHPLVKAVAEYRDTQSLLSRVRTWAEGRYWNGRVYPQWKPAGAATGRASCTTPNVQSLPKEGGFRGCIRPAEGRVLVKADLSQGRLRLCSSVSHWKCSTISDISTLSAIARFLGEWNCSQFLSSMNAVILLLRSSTLALLLTHGAHST